MPENLMIKRLVLEGFGCIKERVDIKLTPLHAFIGPNNSGKSTILQAANILGQAGWGTATVPEGQDLIKNAREKYHSLFRRGETRLIAVSEGHSFEITSQNQKDTCRVWSTENPADMTERSTHSVGIPYTNDGNQLKSQPKWQESTFSRHSGAQIIRLNPDSMRNPSKLIPESRAMILKETGLGLPGLYDAVKERSLKSFLEIQDKLRELFEDIEELQIPALTQNTKVLRIKLKDGTLVKADQMSEGLLYFLGFAVLPYIDGASLIIVEEPENGLHPARIRDVVRALREASKSAQVLIATHSPLVVNELSHDEVTVITRTLEHGTRSTPIASTPNFEARSKTYALGELWLSYANGFNEAPLLNGGPRS